MSRISLLALAALMLLTATLWAQEPSFNPHDPTALPKVPAKLCQHCHSEPPRIFPKQDTHYIIPQKGAFVLDGIQMCISCHLEAHVQHMVGVRPSFPVPPQLPLDFQGKITCLTCHYTHGHLRSERPWASISLADRLFRRERLHKSYLLRQRNIRGQLCLSCHNPNAP